MSSGSTPRKVFPGLLSASRRAVRRCAAPGVLAVALLALSFAGSVAQVAAQSSPVATLILPESTPEGRQLNGTIQLDRPTPRRISVGVEIRLPSGRKLTVGVQIGAGRTKATFPVFPQSMEDDVIGDFPMKVRLERAYDPNTEYRLGDPSSRTVQVIDNDGKYTAFFAASLLDQIPEGAEAPLSLVTSPAPPSGEKIAFRIRLGGTASWPADYALRCSHSEYSVSCKNVDGEMAIIEIGGTGLDIGGGRSRFFGVLRVAAIEDNVAEPMETVTLQLNDPMRAATIGIVDAPASVAVGFTRNDQEAFEDGQASLVFNIDPPSGRSLEIPVTMTGVTATDGVDFQSVNSMTIPAGRRFPAIALTIEDDDVPEEDETFAISIDTSRLPDGVTAGSIATVTYTIRNDDGALSTASFASSAQSASESDGARNATVNLNPAPGQNLTLNYAVSGTAASGSDFTALSGTAAVASGATRVDIPVTIANDSEAESLETVVLTLLPGSGYAVGIANTHTLAIADDDAIPSIAITGGGAVTEGADASFTVTAVPAPSANLTVHLSVSENEADGRDFVTAANEGNKTVTIQANQSSANYAVTTEEDAADEPNGAVTATVAGSTATPETYEVGAPASASVAVNDNDGQTSSGPTASFASAASSVAESAGFDNVTITLSPAPTSALAVKYAVSGTAASGADFAELPGAATVASGETSVTIPVTIIDDNADENDETVILTLSEGSGYEVGSANAHTLTITDNDDAPVSSEDEENGEIPRAFALGQNYPNPFNPTTTIEFAISRTQHVSLAVYDVLGHEVRVLMDGVQPAANYRVSFDASGLPSGAYLYVLRAEEQTAVRKMSLLR